MITDSGNLLFANSTDKFDTAEKELDFYSIVPNYRIKIKNNIEFKKIAIIKKDDDSALVALGFNYIS